MVPSAILPLPGDLIPSLDEGLPCIPKVLHLSWPVLLTQYVSFSTILSFWIFSLISIFKIFEDENTFSNQSQHFLSVDSALHVCTHFPHPSPLHPHDIATVVSPSILMRKAGHRDGKDLAHGHYLAGSQVGIGTWVWSQSPKLLLRCLTNSLFFSGAVVTTTVPCF